MADRCVLELEFEKSIFIFEFNTLELVEFQNLEERHKCLNVESKMCYLGILWQEF